MELKIHNTLSIAVLKILINIDDIIIKYETIQPSILIIYNTMSLWLRIIGD